MRLIHYLKHFLLLLPLALSLSGRAQNWQRDPLLSRLLIHQMAQDTAGLLWVATDPAGDLLTMALACGFGSKASFNRAFRQRYGMAPTQFRRSQAEQ